MQMPQKWQKKFVCKTETEVQEIGFGDKTQMKKCCWQILHDAGVKQNFCIGHDDRWTDRKTTDSLAQSGWWKSRKKI